jgi:hypothetical protein
MSYSTLYSMPSRHVSRGVSREDTAPLHSVPAYVFRLFNSHAGSHTCSSTPCTSHSFIQDVLYSFHPSNSRSSSSSFSLLYNPSQPLFVHSLHKVEPSDLINLHPHPHIALTLSFLDLSVSLKRYCS